MIFTEKCHYHLKYKCYSVYVCGVIAFQCFKEPSVNLHTSEKISTNDHFVPGETDFITLIYYIKRLSTHLQLGETHQ